MSAICRTPATGALLVIVCLIAPSAAAEPLTLSRAVDLAVAHAPWLAQHRTNTAAAAERVVHQGRLPDPQLTLGAINVPTDSFSLRDDDMTMVAVGVRQALPPGATLAVRERRAGKALSREQALLEMEQRNLMRAMREFWLELYFHEQSARVLESARELQARALRAAEGRYRAAQEPQQAVLRARQALARLDERVLAARTEAAQLRARLSRYIGAAADDALPAESPQLPVLSRFDATQHPEWLAATAGADIAQAETELIRQEYKPGLMLDLSYGFRRSLPGGGERADMVSAMVTVDLPVFRRKRQDPRLHEKQALEAGARLAAEDKQRELEAMYRAAYAAHQGLEARVTLLAEQLLPNAQREARVATGALRDANELREAHIKALDAELDLLRVRVNLLKSHVELLYLAGETPS